MRLDKEGGDWTQKGVGGVRRKDSGAYLFGLGLVFRCHVLVAQGEIHGLGKTGEV